MWQTFIEYITCDSVHISLFICIAILSIIGLIEIFYQIYQGNRKITIANEYIKHVYNIAEYANKRIEQSKQWGYSDDLKDINNVADSLNYVQINYESAREAIEEDQYNIPIYSLYCMLYHRRWDNNEIATYCHQISVNYQRSIPKHQRTIKNFLWCIIIPFTKLYRGFCVLFRFLTFPIKKLLEWNNRSFDKSGKWEKVTSLLAEIVTIVNFIYEFSKA